MDKVSNLEEQIFFAALEIDNSDERTDFIRTKCADDDDLRSLVEELLEFHNSSNNILDDTAGAIWGQTPGHQDSVAVGTEVGPYKLLQEIGVGGMGVVYMAEQTRPVRRKVAVKIIKLGMDTRNVIARFEAERQTLAMMDHPNITKVFDAGITTTGRPYFVMELVTGLPITEYCDREKLPLHERIELFYQVCVGIKHAHQKGIIHRDLKPSNIMVTHYDGVAVPKIIDFGIAKAVDQSLTDKTFFTSYGNMIGTPEYMSPEQAEMSGQDIDTRSDVYSLGVLMYELLTGTTPFYQYKKKGIHKFCEAICHEEPELASTRINNLADTVKEISSNRGTDVRSLRRVLRGDMDWILAKCMSKKRSERYETAADLARDVKRYLDGQPVEAVGPNFAYRTRKYARKHKAFLTFGAAIMLTLCACTVVSTLFALQANAARELANKRLLEVDALRKEAEAERDRAQAAEQQLAMLERQSRAQAAAARAVEKFHRDNPDHRLKVSYPSRVTGQANMFTLSSQDQSFQHIANDIDDVTDPQVAEIVVQALDHEVEKTAAESSVQHTREQSHVYQIVINGSGDVNFGQGQKIDIAGIHERHPASNEVIVVGHTKKPGEQGRFLKVLADEQRELFGPNDNVLANTLIQIGDISLQQQDWSVAENHLRESRDILLSHPHDDARLAKVEFLLSKALLKQEKTAAAKETMSKGVIRLDGLRDVPEELVEVIVELKQDLHEKNVELLDLEKSLPGNVRVRLKERIQRTNKKNNTNKK